MAIDIATLADASRAWEVAHTIWFVIGALGLAGIIFGTMSKVMITRARERTRREIAAYVAEGTISPDDAVKMLKAGRTADEIAVEESMRKETHA